MALMLWQMTKFIPSVSDYIDGTITREQFRVLAKFKYPTHQIVFCTDKALKCLAYRGFEEVH